MYHLKTFILITSFVLYASAETDTNFDQSMIYAKLSGILNSSGMFVISRNTLALSYTIIAVTACLFGCGCGVLCLCSSFIFCYEVNKRQNKKLMRLKILYVNPRYIIKSLRRGNRERQTKEKPVYEIPLTNKTGEFYCSNDENKPVATEKIQPYAVSQRGSSSDAEILGLTYARCTTDTPRVSSLS